MRKIKIFVASSKELEEERKMMALSANSLNTALESQGIQVIVVEWENLDASMGVYHKQEEYNEKLRECEVCMVLYWTSFGIYTKQELDIAYRELMAGNNPQKLYVYFKEDEKEVSEELKEFKESFPTKYGHFISTFRNVDTLKAHFLLQFTNHLCQIIPNFKAVELRDGSVFVNGKEYVCLQNVPFVGNNDKYNALKDDIQELEEDLLAMNPDSERYKQKEEKLAKRREELASLESGLWDIASQITKLSTQKCNERFQRAVERFNQGDSQGAAALLQEEDIYKDAKHNIKLIKLGEEGRKNLLVNIDELLLKVDLLKPSMCTHREINIAYEKISAILSNVIDYASVIYGENSKEVLRYCRRAKTCLHEQARRYLPFIERALKIAKCIYADDVDRIVDIYKWDLLSAYERLGDTDAVYKCHMMIIDLVRDKYGEQSVKYIDAIEKYAHDLEEKDLEGAKFWYEKALSLCHVINYETKEEQILKNFLRLYLKRKDWDEVERIIARIKERSPKDKLLYTCINIAKEVSFYSSRAMRYYEEALLYAKDLNDDGAQRAIYIGLSDIYRYNRLNNVDKQIEYLNKALDFNCSSDEWNLYDSLTNAYLRKEDYIAAKECAQKCLEIARAFYEECCQEDEQRGFKSYRSISLVWRSYRNLSRVFRKLNDLNGAIDTQLKFIEFETLREKKYNFRLRGSYMDLARLYNETFQEDKALEVYSNLIGGNVFENISLKEKSDILQHMGWSYCLKEDLSRAEKCYKDAIALNLENRPDEKWADESDVNLSNKRIAIAYFQLAFFYVTAKEYAKAQEALDQSYAFCNSKTIELATRPIYQGIIYCARGEYQKAIDIFESVQNAHCKILTQTEIAHTFLEWNKPMEALDVALKVAAEDPDYAYVHEVLGRIYKKLNDSEKSKYEFETCLALMEKEHAPRFAIRNVRSLIEAR